MTTPPALRFLAPLLLLALSAPSASAQTTYVMRVPTITTGSSQLNQFEGANGWMQVQGFGVGSFRQVSVTSTDATAGATEPGTLNVFMLADPKALPPLYLLSVSGGKLGDGKFTQFTIQAVENIQGLNKATFLLGIEGVIEAIECEGNSGDQVFVNLSIRLTKLGIQTVPLKADGSTDTAVTNGWDFQNNVVFAP